jgi:hypothetical protein
LIRTEGSGTRQLLRLDHPRGTPQVFGPPIRLDARRSAVWPIGKHATASPDTAFVSLSPWPGFAMVSKDRVEVLGPQAGAPGDVVTGLAWLGGRLYLAYEPGALCQFDPETKQFRVLASSRSLDPQNEFDGGSGYTVQSLLADPQQGCVWLSIGSGSSRRGALRAAESLSRQGAGPLETPRQAPVTPETAKVPPPLGSDSPGKHQGGAKSSGTGRRGIWRLTPDKMIFTKIYDEPGPLTWTDDARLLFPQLSLGWFTVDTRTSQVRRLEQYGAADPLSLSAVWGRSCIMVNRQIITGDGRLFTADGAQYQFREKWHDRTMERWGRGFVAFDVITGYNGLWYFELR